MSASSGGGGQKKGLQIPNCKAIIIAHVLRGERRIDLRRTCRISAWWNEIAVFREWGNCSRSSGGREIKSSVGRVEIPIRHPGRTVGGATVAGRWQVEKGSRR